MWTCLITQLHDALYAQSTDQERLRIYTATTIRFFLKLFHETSSSTCRGKVTGLVLQQKGHEMPGRKLPWTSYCFSDPSRAFRKSEHFGLVLAERRTVTKSFATRGLRRHRRHHQDTPPRSTPCSAS